MPVHVYFSLHRRLQVDIPKGYCSENFLFWKVFIPKGHYSEKFYLEELLFWNVFYPEVSLFQNSESWLFGMKIFRDDPSG